jgi:hypothetical protein
MSNYGDLRSRTPPTPPLDPSQRDRRSHRGAGNGGARPQALRKARCCRWRGSDRGPRRSGGSGRAAAQTGEGRPVARRQGSRSIRRSEPCLQLFARNVAVTQDLRKQATADCFAAMHRHHRAASVEMLEEVMAALNANLQSSLRKALMNCAPEIEGSVLMP